MFVCLMDLSITVHTKIYFVINLLPCGEPLRYPFLVCNMDICQSQKVEGVTHCWYDLYEEFVLRLQPY